MSIPTIDTSGYSRSVSGTGHVEFNSPLIIVEGNVTQDVMPDLNKAMKQMEETITSNIVRNMRR